MCGQGFDLDLAFSRVLDFRGVWVGGLSRKRGVVFTVAVLAYFVREQIMVCVLGWGM